MQDVLLAVGDEETFARAKRVGFAGVEVVPSREQLRGGDRLERLHRTSAATGLAVPSIVLGEHSDLGGIADADDVVAEHAREDVARATDWAAALGAEAILVPFFGRAELVGDSDVDRAAAAFQPLCRLAG